MKIARAEPASKLQGCYGRTAHPQEGALACLALIATERSRPFAENADRVDLVASTSGAKRCAALRQDLIGTHEIADFAGSRK
jgi:hypothetical protein